MSAKQKWPTASGAPLLNFTNRFILSQIDLFTLLAPFGEESLRPDSGSMGYWKRAFAGFMLPGCCDSKAEAEPKHNIACVP
jgi:hypothetical protein